MDGMIAQEQTKARGRNSEFHTQLVALVPKLRIQALALTRNGTAANDLVQETVKNAPQERPC